MERISVQITIESPVVLTAMSNSTIMTATHDYISGTLLRGLCAAHYIDTKALGENAHEEEAFRRLFFQSLRFVDAYPRTEGGRAIPVPRSIQKGKADGSYLDMLKDVPKAGFKSVSGFMAIDEDGACWRAVPRKSIFLHMSRSDQKGSLDAGEERLAGKSVDGGIYNYESIDAGQTFEGYILGEKAALEELRQVVGASWQGRLGRSKYTEYGQCSIKLSEPGPVGAGSCSLTDRLYLRLETPMIPESEEAVDAADMLEPLVETLNKALGWDCLCLDREHIYGSRVDVENFVGVWMMRRPRVGALSAGSVFALDCRSPLTAEESERLQEILLEGFGQRRTEGFGQLRLWQPMVLHDAKQGAEKTSAKRRHITHPEVREKAAAILKERILDKVREAASKDAEAARHSLSRNAAHMLTRLDGLLGKRETAVREFKMRLLSERRADSTSFVQHLQAIRIQGRSAYDLLTEDLQDMPYRERLSEFLQEDHLSSVYSDLGLCPPDASDGDIYYEYWHWFFRHCRKIVNTRKEEAV